MKGPAIGAIVIAVVFVLSAIYFIERQRAVAPTGGNASWGRIGAYFEPDPVSPAVSPEQTPLSDTDTEPETLVIPKPATPVNLTPKPDTAQPPKDGTFDYKAMLNALRHDPDTPPPQTTSKTFLELLESYSFAPSLAAPEQKQKTVQQEKLFAYGNQIGAQIKGFAAVNPNMGQLVIDQANHRDDQTKGDAVRELGSRYKALGENILALRDIPPEAENAHQKLGQSYVQLGEALAKVPDATTDQAFLAAITAYNNKADAYTGAFTGMVTLFTTLNVNFDESDSGSVFSFRRN